jgi:hypothetical protein
MVLIIAACDSRRKVDIWMLGRADLRLRFSSGICCSLPTDCGHMGAHLALMVIMVIMAMVMLAMVMMVMLMVIIVP